MAPKRKPEQTKLAKNCISWPIFLRLRSWLHYFYFQPKTKHMKKIVILCGWISIFSSAYSTTNSSPHSPSNLPVKANEVYLPVGKTGHLISLMDLSRISVKDFETLSGKKMKLIEKVSFKLGQQKLKKSINNDGTFSQKRFEKYFGKVAGVGGFSLVGLLLGLFLSLIGVLIAYLMGNDKSRIRWAWIGAIISLIVWGAILI
jgi:hypothetical protein